MATTLLFNAIIILEDKQIISYWTLKEQFKNK